MASLLKGDKNLIINVRQVAAGELTIADAD